MAFFLVVKYVPQLSNCESKLESYLAVPGEILVNKEKGCNALYISAPSPLLCELFISFYPDAMFNCSSPTLG